MADMGAEQAPGGDPPSTDPGEDEGGEGEVEEKEDEGGKSEVAVATLIKAIIKFRSPVTKIRRASAEAFAAEAQRICDEVDDLEEEVRLSMRLSADSPTAKEAAMSTDPSPVKSIRRIAYEAAETIDAIASDLEDDVVGGMTAGGGGADLDEEMAGGGRRNGGFGNWFSRGHRQAADAETEANPKSTLERLSEGTLVVQKYNSFLATRFGDSDIVDNVMREGDRSRRRLLQFAEDGGRWGGGWGGGKVGRWAELSVGAIFFNFCIQLHDPIQLHDNIQTDTSRRVIRQDLLPTPQPHGQLDPRCL